jgi:hypothetical protein
MTGAHNVVYHSERSPNMIDLLATQDEKRLLDELKHIPSCTKVPEA